jgi:tubulin polyglutamylase TTLL9
MKQDHKWKADGPQAETYVAQRYVDRPYTIGGKKFDLRLFALVTSFTPLTVWVHRSGFCRFSSERYDEVGRENIDNTYMHLTNYSIQKKVSSASDLENNMDFKWDVHSLKLMLIARHGRVAIEQMFDEIQVLIVNSLLAVQKVCACWMCNRLACHFANTSYPLPSINSSIHQLNHPSTNTCYPSIHV